LYAAILANGKASGTQQEKHPSNHKAHEAWENREKFRKDPKLRETNRRQGKRADAALMARQGGNCQRVLQSVSHCISTNPFNLLSEQ
jgi:hypothetical protein